MWALATLRHRNPRFLTALAVSAERALAQPGFSARWLSSLTWGMAKLGFRHVPLMRAIAGQVAKRADEYAPQGLANTTWAFATLKYRDKDALKARQDFAEHFFRSNALQCTATARILIPAECSAVS